MFSFSAYLQKCQIEPGLQSILFDLSIVAEKIADILKIEQKGYSGDQNLYGEQQLKLDVLANSLFVETLQRNRSVALIASEELDKPVKTESVSENYYSVAFDPLDGSSLVDVNQAIGSIIGIYPGVDFVGRKGLEQSAVMMIVYGPRLTFLLSVGKGVEEFIFDPEKKGFFLNTEQLKLAAEGKIFAPGNLRACKSEKWYEQLLLYWIHNGYTLRYSGGMVPDVNQIFRKGGGIFTYPGFSDQPRGKLRLLYECAPLAFLVEQAGGKAFSFEGRILDQKIESYSQCTPVFLGSNKEIETVLSYYFRASG